MPEITATKGGATSNSYATIEEADALVDTIYGAGDWSELDDDDKARLLIMATEFIDGMSIKYDQSDDEQALKFPVETTSHSNGDGFTLATKACVRQALYLSKNFESIQSAIEDGIQGVQSQNLGGVSQTKFSANMNGFKRFDGKVLSLLIDFIDNDFTLGRA